MKFGKAFQEEQRNLSPSRREQRTFNRRITTAGLIGAMAAGGIYVGLKNSDAGIPNNAPKVNVTVMAGEGADAVINQVEPGALANAQEKQELEDYINQQGNLANHELEAGQTVHVPIIDSISKK